MPRLSLVVISLILLVFCTALKAETYTVTATSCDGPGSIKAAIELANNNPGKDTISFSNGLSISGLTAGGCGLLDANDPDQFYLGVVTDDLEILGHGASIAGFNLWTTFDGVKNRPGECPADLGAFAKVVALAPGLLRIEDGVSVEMRDLTVTDLTSFASLRESASLSMDNMSIVRIFDWFKKCDRPGIYAAEDNASLTITNSYLRLFQNGAEDIGSPDQRTFWVSAMISADDAAELNIENTTFERGRGAIEWGGTANITGSRFIEVGGINITGGTANIVNSAILGRFHTDEYAKIIAGGTSVVNVIASTLSINSLDCLQCALYGRGGVVAKQGSVINLRQSAVGVNFPDIEGVLIREADGGNVTADDLTWLQPVISQGAIDLGLITDQPALLTAPPGLPNKVQGANYWPVAVTPLLGDTITPGVLIDAIPDAAAGGANELFNPIDGQPITVDALGNPRVDSNGARNIGAVQLTLAPSTAVSATADGSVTLSWSRPTDPVSGAITGYQVCFGTGTTPDPSSLGTDCEDGAGNPGSLQTISNAPDVLTGEVAGLTNGDTYWFLVRGVNPGPGPWSNTVTGTPYGEIGTPSLTVTSTNCGSALLEWTQPDLGGRTFGGYVVSWFKAGTDTVLETMVIPDYDTLSTMVTGLDCNARYQFSVTATTANGATGEQGTGIVFVPPPPPVPALDQLGLLLLILLTLGFGIARARE
ncbi:MAG: fibronectin type III domain-containing protein [Xanthomonadales bacterium]|nr:fibronectin type III domain-containing protein [Xanthomonadales bacterium]